MRIDQRQFFAQPAQKHLRRPPVVARRPPPAPPGARIIESRRPMLLADDMVLLTGEIPRATAPERGLPVHQSPINGVCPPDPQVPDDQSLVVSVRGKGLVVMTGCTGWKATHVIADVLPDASIIASFGTTLVIAA